MTTSGTPGSGRLAIIERPARPARQRQLPDHAHRVKVYERGGAVLAERFPQVEAVQPPAAAVVGEPVRMRPHLDLREQLLIGAAEDADAGSASVAREEEIVLLVDQNAGNARQLRGKGIQVRAG